MFLVKSIGFPFGFKKLSIRNYGFPSVFATATSTAAWIAFVWFLGISTETLFGNGMVIFRLLEEVNIIFAKITFTAKLLDSIPLQFDYEC